MSGLTKPMGVCISYVGAVFRHKDGELVRVVGYYLQREPTNNEAYDKSVWVIWYRPLAAEWTDEPYVRTQKHFVESFLFVDEADDEVLEKILGRDTEWEKKRIVATASGQ